MDTQLASKENRDHHKDSNATQVKRPNKPAPKKQGMDRRMKVRDTAFKEQMHTKLAGQEVPKTLRVSGLRVLNPASPRSKRCP